jgi:hypothetical protein
LKLFKNQIAKATDPGAFEERAAAAQALSDVEAGYRVAIRTISERGGLKMESNGGAE